MKNIWKLSAVVFFGIMFTAASRANDCPGVEAAGGCWFLGESGEDCVQTCYEYDLLYDHKTATVGGNSFKKNKDNCAAVAKAFGYETEVKHCTGWKTGCVRSEKETYLCDIKPTAARAKSGGQERFCACR